MKIIRTTTDNEQEEFDMTDTLYIEFEYGEDDEKRLRIHFGDGGRSIVINKITGSVNIHPVLAGPIKIV